MIKLNFSGFKLATLHHVFFVCTAVFGVIWTLSVLSFLYSDHLSIPAFVNPLALVIIMFLFMLNPTKTFRHEARFWMIRYGHSN